MHSSFVGELWSNLVGVTKGSDFLTIAAPFITEHSPSLRESQSVMNAQAAYLASFEDLDAASSDPVCEHFKRLSLPPFGIRKRMIRPRW